MNFLQEAGSVATTVMLAVMLFDPHNSPITWRLTAATNNGCTTVHIAYAYGSF